MFGLSATKRPQHVIEVHTIFDNDHTIKVSKNGLDFSIIIKETVEPDNVDMFVWFLHVKLPKANKYILCAYGTKKFLGWTVAQEEAFMFLSRLEYDFYKRIKEL
jgi:hypothetical protein